MKKLLKYLCMAMLLGMLGALATFCLAELGIIKAPDIKIQALFGYDSGSGDSPSEDQGSPSEAAAK
tara:strand:- start:631 stop:828 length:198 start_codon:yes stop_codon:yes gene_type:complete